MRDRRILFVHAHPDDETVSTAATMARYAAADDHVTLVTCTLGEEGEIHVPALAGLAAAEGDQLGGYRLVELERACAALGVTDHRFLGGAGRYRDSGMMGLPTNDHPRAFWRADLDEAAEQLLEVIREVRPQVLVTYDPNGGYGHPDHIQSHRVAMRAVELAEAEGSGPQKVYWTAIPRSVLEAGLKEFVDSSDNPFAGVESVDELPMGTPDDRIAARIDGGEYAEAKMAAVRAHATQIPPTSWLYTLSANFGEDVIGTEYYELVKGARSPAGAGGADGLASGDGVAPGDGVVSGDGLASADGLEDDLFAGVAVPSAV